MADVNGEITFARGYDPYGVVTYTSGTSQTEFGFTGEQYGDSTQLLFLRARHYSPADGRFLSRDTWSGGANRPLSLNRWMYVEGNPVNYTDPTGNLRIGCNTDKGRIATAKKAVPISFSDPLNTYTAAGIAVQCFGGDYTWPWKDINYSGLGIA
jgi:RHS repeat-associated protein